MQSLLNVVHDLCDEWQRKDHAQHTRINISWIMGHDGVEGNERADAEAKKVIQEGSSPHSMLPELLQNKELPRSITAAGSAFRTEVLTSWWSLWEGSPHQKWMAKIDTKLLSASFLRATDGMTRAQASILMQLRTGHAPLQRFLHRIDRVDSPHCPACQGEDEMVNHYLFDCPVHAHAWHGLSRKLGWLSKSLCHLLGNWRVFKTMLKYVGETGRFRGTYGELSMKST